MAERPAVPDGDDLVLFSYGTLQQPEVQDSVFARRPPSWPDRVPAHRLDWITITDPEVIDVSGSDRHPVLVATGDPDDAVEGTALRITAAELAAADDYDVDDYDRTQVTLGAGGRAWVYALTAS